MTSDLTMAGWARSELRLVGHQSWRLQQPPASTLSNRARGRPAEHRLHENFKYQRLIARGSSLISYPIFSVG